jgi:2-dehydro-3-deoxygalactonokinase
MSEQQRAEWIAVDWGTTNLRAWAMEGDAVLASASAPDGMAVLARDGFEPALLRVIASWLDDDRVTPVVACGMAGARQGWREAPYATVPGAPLDATAFVRVPTVDRRIAVTIVHGMSQSDPPDVMRGEETQIAGLLAMRPGLAGTVCLPGTHTKWADVAGGAVRSFRTFMTGELFALMRDHSILRHSLGDAAEATDPNAFDQAVLMAAADPAALAAHLFGLRAAGLLGNVAPAQARGRMSGLLIGTEVAAMGDTWRQGPVALVGNLALCASYARALGLLGAGEVETHDGDACVLAGLHAAWRLASA